MKPASPILIAAIVTAFTFTFAASSHAQGTIVEKTTIDQKTVTHTPPPSVVINTTDIEFQPASSAGDLNVQMLRDFESVKADHAVAAAIARNPEIVNDTNFVAKHPALQAFLEKYPDARAEIVKSPGNFVTPVAGSKWNSHEVAGIPRR
ncbi:MAG TPA: hypothetical protein VMT64_14765 [Candidatus Binataceae bacterium]|nr:hypothetical protein [Candidatus Binataceae bacterium]